MTRPATTSDDALAAVRLLDAKGLAELLHVSTRTVRRYAAGEDGAPVGFPGPVRIGPKLLRWRLLDVQRWIEKRARGWE